MPPKKPCPECRKWVSEDSSACGWCGYTFPAIQQNGDPENQEEAIAFQRELTSAVSAGEGEEATVDFMVATIAAGIGAGATYGTYIAAGPGATYWLVWGPVAYAGWRLLKGATRFVLYPTAAALGVGILALAVFGVAIAALVLALGGSDFWRDDTGALGESEEPAIDESFTEVRPGDCVKDPGSGEIAELEPVSCSQPGALRVTNTFNITGYDSYPGLDAMDSLFLDRCS